MKQIKLIAAMALLTLYSSGVCMGQMQLISYEPAIKGLSQHPVSARAEGMGQAGVALGGSILDIHLNPAGLVQLKGPLETAASFIKPIADEKKSYISYLGIAHRVNQKLVLGLSWLNFFSKFPALIPSTDTEGDAIDVRETFLTATGAYRINENWIAGLNISYFDHLYGNKRHFKSPLFGVGIQYEKKLDLLPFPTLSNQLVRGGISLDNASFIDVEWKFDQSKNVFPLTSHLRAGGAYQFELSAPWLQFSAPVAGDASQLIEGLFQVQYLNFLNKGELKNYGKWGFNLGAEVVLAKLIALRAGYLYEKREGDKERFSVNGVLSYPYRKGLTAGIGLTLPVNRWTGKKIPLDIALDVMHRKAYKHIKENPVMREFPFTNIGLRITWQLGS